MGAGPLGSRVKGKVPVTGQGWKREEADSDAEVPSKREAELVCDNIS